MTTLRVQDHGGISCMDGRRAVHLWKEKSFHSTILKMLKGDLSCRVWTNFIIHLAKLAS